MNLLPGITDFQVDLSITLPLGMEVYAAYATGAWLSNRRIDHGTRMFAKWSSLSALFIGGAGQVTYHLLNSAHVEHAPTPVVSVVSCIPVVVLGMASQLAYRLTKHTKDQPQAAVDAAPVAAAMVAPATVAPATVAETPAGSAPEPEDDVEPAVAAHEDAEAPAAVQASGPRSVDDSGDQNPENEVTAQLDLKAGADEGVEHTLQLDLEPHIGSMFYDQAAELAASGPTSYEPHQPTSYEPGSYEPGSYEPESYEPAGDIWSQIDLGGSAADTPRSQYLDPGVAQPDEARDATADGQQDEGGVDEQDRADEQNGTGQDSQQDDVEDHDADDDRRAHRGGRTRGPLSDEERLRILQLAGDGHSEREVSRKVGRSRATVHRVVVSEHQEDDSEDQSQDEELELVSAG